MKQKTASLKKLINLFLFLVLFDGILRKWIMPGLSNVIMMIKVIVAILIVFMGNRYYKYLTFWDKGLVFLGGISFLTALTFGHGNLTVAVWGCLPLWLIPVCVIISRSFNHEDILRCGKVLMYTAIVNFFITVIEFTQPITSFINSGTETESDSQLSNISISDLAGAFRPSGIFMHNSQSGAFLLLAFSFCLYFLYLKQPIVNKRTLYLALFSCTFTPIFTVSRTMVFFVLGMYIVYILFAVKKGILKRLILPSIIIVGIVAIFANTDIGETAVSNMQNRFQNASESTVGTNQNTVSGTIYDLINRTIVYNINAIVDPHTLDGDIPPFWGYGQGMSTQVGAKILGVKGHAGFILAEWDGLRIVCESGILLGWAIIFFRVGYFLRFLGRFRKSNSNKLSIFLYPAFCNMFYLMTTWGNAFFFCFGYICGGLYLASINKQNNFSNL